MEEDGVGDDPDPIAGRLHPPAEVDVLAKQGHPGVEAARLLPDVAPHEHARAGDGDGIPVPVVLPLVDLSGLDAGDPATDRVDGQAGLDDDVAVSPVHQLGAEYGRRRSLGRATQQLLQRIRGRLAVVVQQPEPLNLVSPGAARRPAGHWRTRSLVLNSPPHCGRIAGTAVHSENRPGPQLSRQHCATAVSAARVDGDDALHRLGLLGQRVHQTRQPRGAVVSDDDRGDHMLGVRVGWRQEDSLAIRVRWPGLRHVSCRLALMGVPVNNTRIWPDSMARQDVPT